MHTLPLLSLLIWLPIVTGVVLLLLGEQRVRIVRHLSLVTALLTLLLTVLLYIAFDRTTAAMQFVERIPWIVFFGLEYSFGELTGLQGGIAYALGVDGIALPLLLLTALIAVIVVVAAYGSVHKRVAQYLAVVLLMTGMMNGVFVATDAVLFYVFWEAMLIPMYLLIGIWGGPRRVYASIKFFLYTFAGSVLMLLALLYLYHQSGSFVIADFYGIDVPMAAQMLLFVAFLIAFAVKIPMWPVHTWLPDAHVEAPTGGSVILAAIMLKMGGYGFLRFSLPIVPQASAELAWLVIVPSLIAIVYIGLVALAQQDMKKLIAYSSIAHMGFVTLGIFAVFAMPLGVAGRELALQGAMVQMISHGLISAALFLCIGVLYDRMHSRAIADYGGVVHTMPRFAALMVFFAMANAGLPGTSGFVGEFMVIVGVFQASKWYAFIAAVTLITSAAYMLWLVKRVVFGGIGNERVAALRDIHRYEWLTLGVLAVGVLALGIYPAPLIDVMTPTIHALLTTITAS